MRKLNLLLIFASLTYSAISNAQLVNNGAVVSIANGGLLYIDNDYVHNDGVISNNGAIFVNKNWTNNSTANKVFDVNSIGEVSFAGSGHVIGGYGITQFPGLYFLGTGEINLKKDIEITGIFHLGDSEVLTEANHIAMLNSNANALEFNKGFINTSKGGKFSRNTNQNLAYYFPFGSSAQGLIRPISIVPNNNASNTFTAALVTKDPSSDGYSRLSKRNDLKIINDKFYYLLAQSNGLSNVEVNFYKTQKDADFNWVANWVDNRIWQKIVNVKAHNVVVPTLMPSFSNYDQQLTHTSHLPLSNQLMPYNLVQTNNIANQLEIFNAFSPDGDGKNDTWEIKNIDAFPDNDVKIYDRSGNLVYQTKSYTQTKSWDGQNVVSGTYFYILRVKMDGEDKYYKGSVTIVKK